MQTRMFEGRRSGGNFQPCRYFKRCIKPEKAYLIQLTKGAQEKGSISAIFSWYWIMANSFNLKLRTYYKDSESS